MPEICFLASFTALKSRKFKKFMYFNPGRKYLLTGKVVPEDGMNDSADLQWFTRSVLAQALTNGYCAIPIVAGPCPHPNACLNCAHFRTDATFLEVHRAELHETERVIAKAEANGWARQSEMNARKRTSLINIVSALEASHG